MNNKLFLICPFSCMEKLLQSKYGNEIYFLTCSGAILQYEEVEYISEVKRFILREQIKTIYIVNDTSCRFINGIIKKNKLYGLKSERILEDLYVEHYLSDFQNQSLLVQQNKLAELNIRNQANELMNSTLLGSSIFEFYIDIKGLITTKEKDLFKEVQIENSGYKVYEL